MLLISLGALNTASPLKQTLVLGTPAVLNAGST